MRSKNCATELVSEFLLYCQHFNIISLAGFSILHLTYFYLLQGQIQGFLPVKIVMGIRSSQILNDQADFGIFEAYTFEIYSILLLRLNLIRNL